jgi:CheY-like chemotaxis protein
VIDAAAPIPKAGQPPLVLVADDDSGINLLVAQVAGRLGLGAVVASDGATAVRLAAEHKLRLCCAILDVLMPRLDGIAAAQQIQQLVPDLPIVLMSAAFPANFAERAAQLRIAYVLPKPFQLAELIGLMSQFVAAPPAL